MNTPSAPTTQKPWQQYIRLNREQLAASPYGITTVPILDALCDILPIQENPKGRVDTVQDWIRNASREGLLTPAEAHKASSLLSIAGA